MTLTELYDRWETIAPKLARCGVIPGWLDRGRLVLLVPGPWTLPHMRRWSGRKPDILAQLPSIIDGQRVEALVLLPDCTREFERMRPKPAPADKARSKDDARRPEDDRRPDHYLTRALPCPDDGTR